MIENTPPLSLLRRNRLEVRSGLSRSSIYSRLDPKSPHYDPDFPKPIKLGSGKNPPVAWIEAEVQAWIESKITNSRPIAEHLSAAQPLASVKPRSVKNHAG
jgi:prophage regulatory protein